MQNIENHMVVDEIWEHPVRRCRICKCELDDCSCEDDDGWEE